MQAMAISCGRGQPSLKRVFLGLLLKPACRNLVATSSLGEARQRGWILAAFQAAMSVVGRGCTRARNLPIHCDQSPVATVKTISQNCPKFFLTPPANWRTKTPKTRVFLGRQTPSRHFSDLAIGIKLTFGPLICSWGYPISIPSTHRPTSAKLGALGKLGTQWRG